MSFLIVFFGAGIGGAVRYGVNLLAERLGLAAFPVATLVVNVAGSFLIGVIGGCLASRPGPSQGWSLFLTTGVLGGFTTFSAFSLDAASLVQRGRLEAAAAYVFASVILSLAAVFAGLALVRPLARG